MVERLVGLLKLDGATMWKMSGGSGVGGGGKSVERKGNVGSGHITETSAVFSSSTIFSCAAMSFLS